VKLSVSLPDEDVAFLDDYARETDADSRSAVIQYSIKLLRQHRLATEYDEAFAEWEGSEDALLWETVTGDGIEPEEPWWEPEPEPQPERTS
jgi:Arc/MetJ-type ribon-helix-helix transcriptional regulator